DESIDQPLSITTYNQEHKQTQAYQELNLDGKYLLDTHNSKTYYYHRDHQGSIIALTNQEGEIVESFIYDESYGTILLHNKLEQTYNPYCYTAREFESDDLYYYRARYYDPTIQRFLSKDPIEFLSGDYNFYRYVGNDPLNFIDPSGMKKGCLPKELKDKLKKPMKALANKLSKSLVKRLGVMVVSAATGVGIVVTIGGAIWTAYDLWSSKDDIFELYDLLTSDEFDLTTDDMVEAVGAIATGQDPFPDCDDNDKKLATTKKEGGTKITEDGKSTFKPRKPRQPDKDKWKENGGTVKEHPDGSVTYTNKDGVSVKYNKEGYPDFSPHSPEAPTKIEGMKGNTTDYTKANLESPLSKSQGVTGQNAPKGYTWHHMEDGKHMQLVPKDIHSEFSHTGGASIVKNGV
ncbi:RHS repeat-associated core domain-containing protein, partial [Sulfurimonas sp.]